MIHPTHRRAGACIVRPRHVIVETTYYQNASRLGGTALASYPEVRLRAGVAPRIEAFVDTPAAIAKSGLNGAGIYTDTNWGAGVKLELARSGGVIYGLTMEEHPPLGALSSADVVPQFSWEVAAQWNATPRLGLSFAAGQLRFSQSSATAHGTAMIDAVSLNHIIDKKTMLTYELASQSMVTLHGSPQTSGTFAIQRSIAPHTLFHVQLGTAFNASGGTKPHYLAAGFNFGF